MSNNEQFPSLTETFNQSPFNADEENAASGGSIPPLGAMPDEEGNYSEEPPKFKGGKKSNVNKLIILVGALIGLIAIALGGLMLKKRFSSNDGKAAEVAAIVAPKVATESAANLDARKKEIQEEEVRTQAAAAAAADALAAQSPQELTQAPDTTSAGATNTSPTQTQQRTGNNQNGETEITPEQRKMTGGVLLAGYSNNEPPAAASQPRASSGSALPFGYDADGQPSDTGAGGRSSRNSLSAKLEPSTLTARVAGNLPNLNYLLRQGTLIPCALITEIDTTLSGLTTCSVTQDIYSANGRVLLIERGSKVNGQQTTALMQGQARVFVLWTRIDTPNGVTMNIDSPAVGSLGAAGIGAYIDTHFWERFGGAIMLSMIKDLSALVIAKNSNGSQPSYQNSQEAAENMAAKALENSINIPPTGRVNAATVVNVMVARDVTFEDVYKVVK